MKLDEIASRIKNHLVRLAEDKEWNRTTHGSSIIWYAGVCRAGRFVMVRYVSYQDDNHITKQEAEAYLAWLDAGNKGRHWDQQREARGGAL